MTKYFPENCHELFHEASQQTAYMYVAVIQADRFKEVFVWTFFFCFIIFFIILQYKDCIEIKKIKFNRVVSSHKKNVYQIYFFQIISLLTFEISSIKLTSVK